MYFFIYFCDSIFRNCFNIINICLVLSHSHLYCYNNNSNNNNNNDCFGSNIRGVATTTWRAHIDIYLWTIILRFSFIIFKHLNQKFIALFKRKNECVYQRWDAIYFKCCDHSEYICTVSTKKKSEHQYKQWYVQTNVANFICN